VNLWATFRRLIGRAYLPEAGQMYDSLRWPAVPSSPNPTPQNDVISRSRAEAEIRNSALARRVVSAWSSALTGGSGFTPMFSDPELRRRWDSWSTGCDAAGRLDWVGVLLQVCECVITSGEAFVLLQVSEDVPEVPLALQVLGPEWLDVSKMNSTDTVAGIVFDGVRRAGYWIFKRHPAISGTTLDSVLVPASDCLHIYKANRPTEQRGSSWFEPVLYSLRLLKEFLEADLQRQKTSALVAGFIVSPDGSAQPFPTTPQGQLALEPATLTQLPVGTTVEFSNPTDHGIAFAPFTQCIIRQIAAGMNMPYETLSTDIGQTTFASGRLAILEWRRQIEAIQYGVLIPQLCQPILNRWLELASALGIAEAVETPRWACPTVEALDRSAEIQSTMLAIRAGLQTRREAVESAGWNIEGIDAELAADQSRARGLGLTLDVDPDMTHQGQKQPASQGQPASQKEQLDNETALA
jgi:lambda family phage portal protein